MPYDVFISYARADEEQCLRVARILREVIGLRVFVDLDEIAGGNYWRAQIGAALSDGYRPDVLVLATRTAEGSPAVQDELRQVRELGLPLVFLEYDLGSAVALGASRAEHHLDPDCDDVSLERQLRRSLLRRVLNFLDEQRKSAEGWFERLLPAEQTSFWSEQWRSLLWSEDADAPRSQALIARGGSGKSVLFAHLVRSLIRERVDWYPIVLLPQQLTAAGIESVVRRLGARNPAELADHLSALAAPPFARKVAFVVDGLDHAPGLAPEIAPLLNLLVGAAPTVIGCRDGVWNGVFRSQISIATTALGALDLPFVRRVIERVAPRLAGTENNLLTVPLFLDLTLQNARYWVDIPATETEFFERTWNDALKPREVRPTRHDRSGLLARLAQAQLAALQYEVPRSAVVPPGVPGDDIGPDLAELTSSGLVVETFRPLSEPTLRLRHDLFDVYSMTRLLLDRAAGAKRREALYARMEVGCGWSVLAGLVRHASDRERREVLDEVFDTFLFVLDLKSTGKDLDNDRAWAVTYVLKECFAQLLPLIVHCLRACVDSAPARPHPTQPVSRRDPPQLTQVSASTLLSAFGALDRGTWEQSELALPVLTRVLQNEAWLQARTIEAVSRFMDNPAALAAVVELGHETLRSRKDLKALEYVAEALSGRSGPGVATVLRSILSDPEIQERQPSAARKAAKALNSTDLGAVPVPARTEAEIIAGLAPTQIVRGEEMQSDWAVVKDYADYLTFELQSGRPLAGPGVLPALVKALEHRQTFVRSPVAECLGWSDDPRARDALLDELLEDVVPEAVSTAVGHALARQIARADDAADRTLRRILALRALAVAERRQRSTVASALRSAVIPNAGLTNEALLFDERSAEVLRPTRSAFEAVRFRIVDEAERPLTPGYAELVTPEIRASVGKGFETKYRVAALCNEDGVLQVDVVATSWEVARGFHHVALEQPERLTGRLFGRWPEPFPLGADRLPGIAVVHALVVTADRKLLLARRSEHVSYAPRHWSASFEEQITTVDFSSGEDAAAAATCRGFQEELGLDADPAQVATLSMLLEIPPLNLAFVTLLKTPHSFEEIRRRWESDPRPSHHHEAEDLGAVGTDKASLADLLDPRSAFAPLHPTSALRVAMLRRHQQG